MAGFRDIQINGPTLVLVKFGSQILQEESEEDPGPNVALQLGLAEKGIRIIPRFVHRDVFADDYGPDIPAEVLWMLADCTIQMTLVHYDADILDICLSESMGGSSTGEAGILAGAGMPMGNGQDFFAKNNHYISLNLTSPVLNNPYRFPSSYLSERPMELPLGTKRSLVELNWRAIPYRQPPQSPSFELVSSGSILWDHNLDSTTM